MVLIVSITALGHCNKYISLIYRCSELIVDYIENKLNFHLPLMKAKIAVELQRHMDKFLKVTFNTLYLFHLLVTHTLLVDN